MEMLIHTGLGLALPRNPVSHRGFGLRNWLGSNRDGYHNLVLVLTKRITTVSPLLPSQACITVQSLPWMSSAKFWLRCHTEVGIIVSTQRCKHRT